MVKKNKIDLTIKTGEEGDGVILDGTFGGSIPFFANIIMIIIKEISDNIDKNDRFLLYMKLSNYLMAEVLSIMEGDDNNDVKKGVS